MKINFKQIISNTKENIRQCSFKLKCIKRRMLKFEDIKYIAKDIKVELKKFSFKRMCKNTIITLKYAGVLVEELILRLKNPDLKSEVLYNTKRNISLVGLTIKDNVTSVVEKLVMNIQSLSPKCRKALIIGIPMVIFMMSSAGVGLYMTTVVNSKEVEIELNTKFEEDNLTAEQKENEEYDPGHEKNPYIISSEEDMIKVQEFSKTNTCAGMYFEIDEALKRAGTGNMGTGNDGSTGDGSTEDDEDVEFEEGAGATEDVETPYNLDLTLRYGGKEFYGIGQNRSYPFKGNIDFKSITIKTDTNLFYFVGAGAKIGNVTLIGEITNEKNKIVYKNNNGGNNDSGVAGLINFIYVRDSGETAVNVNNVNIKNLSTFNKTSIVGGTQNTAGIIAKIRNVNSSKLTVNVFQCNVVAKIRGVGDSNNDDAADTDTNLYNSDGVVGGVIGHISTVGAALGKNTYVNLNGITVGGEYTCDRSTVGGVIGFAQRGTYITLQNKIDASELSELIITKKNDANYKGYVLGAQINTIINKWHKRNEEDTTDCEIVAPKSEYAAMYTVPDIGRQLGSYNESNGSLGVTQNHDRTHANMYHGLEDIEDHYVTEESEGVFIIDDDADLAKISIAFCSEGRFGLNNLGSIGGTSTNYTNLRKATFKVKADVDMSTYNIYRLNNVYYGGAFAGKFIGEDVAAEGGGTRKPIIDMGTIVTNQTCIALWGYVGTSGITPTHDNNESLYKIDVEFSNFTVQGNISTPNDAAGVVYIIERVANSSYVNYQLQCDFKDITSEVNITKHKRSSNEGYIGGILGQVYHKEYSPEINFDNIQYTGKIDIEYDTIVQYIGGLIGRLRGSNNEGTKVNIDNYKFSGIFEWHYTSNTGYVGATIGHVNQANGRDSNSYTAYRYNEISIRNSTYTSPQSITMNTFDGGLIMGREWTWVDVELENITVQGITYNANQWCGVLWSRVHGNVDIKNITYSNVTLNNSSYMSCIAAAFYNGFMNVEGIKFENCKMNSNHGNDIVCDTEASGDSAYRGIVSINNVSNINSDGTKIAESYSDITDIYSAYNGYEGQLTYNNNMLGRCALFYNVSKQVYKDDNGNWNVKDIPRGYISGKGTDDSPIILDTPEKLVIYSAITNVSNSSKPIFLKYFSEYASAGDKIVNGIAGKGCSNSEIDTITAAVWNIMQGNVVIAADMEMAPSEVVNGKATGYGYSYNPALLNKTNIYGFNVKKYLSEKKGISSPIPPQISRAAVDAIKVLDGKKPVTYTDLTLEDVTSRKPKIHMDATLIHNLNNVAGTTDKEKWPLDFYKLREGFKDNRRGISGRYGGLFTYVRGDSTSIKNLHLEGNYYFYGFQYGLGGALICPYSTVRQTHNDYNEYAGVSGATLNISHIDIGNLKSESNHNVTNSSTRGTALLISDITGNAKVTIDDVKILSTTNVKGDALIGFQSGGNTQTKLSNIELNDALNNTFDANGESNEPSTNYKTSTGTIDGIKYGLFFFNIESGTAMYNYDAHEEHDDIYTNDSNVTPIIVNTDSNSATYSYKVNLELLKKKNYVYKGKNVIVNMIYSHITKGSGTKDDPYVLTKPEQFLTLSYCLESGGSNTPKDSWFIGNAPTGFDEKNSSTWGSTNKNGDMTHIRKAYYVLGNDIDFNDPNLSSNVQQNINSYVGVGSNAYPFSGCLSGKDKANEKIYTITLPKLTGRSVSMFGLFHYTNGIYVRDLNIKLADGATLNVNNDSNAAVGLVASFSQGGDSVIDNVKVSGTIKYNNDSSAIAGYIGRMEFGSLTIVDGTCNDDPDNFVNNVADFNITSSGDAPVRNTRAYMNAVVGRITGGAYIVYHGDNSGETNRQFTFTNVNDKTVKELRYTNHVNIINSKFLEAAGKLRISKNTNTGNSSDTKVIGGYFVDIKSEEQLFLLSLGISSGALSGREGLSEAHYWPYRGSSSTWKSEKVWGKSGSKDWGEVNLVDRAGTSINYPSILQYFEEDGRTDGLITASNYYKDTALIFNKTHSMPSVYNNSKYDHATLNQYNMTYRLTKSDGTYNMQKEYRVAAERIKLEFRGLSCGEHTALGAAWNYVPGAFAANIEGIEKTSYRVNTLDGKRKNSRNTTIIMNVDNSENGSNYIESAGFIPNMSAINWEDANNQPKYIIRNLSLTGNVKCNTWAGMLMGNSYTQGNVDVEDIYVFDSTVTSTGENAAGGLIGRIEQGSTARHIEIYDVEISNVDVRCGYATGMLVGTYRDGMRAHDIKITTGTCLGTASSGINPSTLAGGIIGYYYSLYTPIDTLLYNIEVNDVKIRSDHAAGGIVGYLDYNSNTDENTGISNITLNNMDIQCVTSQPNRLGKFFGHYYHNKSSCEIGLLNCIYVDKGASTESGYSKPTRYMGKQYDTFNYHTVLMYAKDYNQLNTHSEGKIYRKNLFTAKDKAQTKEIDLIPTGIDLDNSNEGLERNMVKWSNEDGTIIGLLNSILEDLSLITNDLDRNTYGTYHPTGLLNGGNKRDNFTLNHNNNIEINIIPMKIEEDKAVRGEDGKLTVSKDLDGNFVFKQVGFDTGILNEEVNNTCLMPDTYSIIEVKYFIDANKKQLYKTVQIPFYIDQTINVDTYNRVEIGHILNNSAPKGNATFDMSITEDSSFTVYSEYTYGSTRKGYKDEIYVDKVFTLGENMSIPKNTELTLVDITDGQCKTYYYHVSSEGGISEIALAAFKDEDGNPFKERDITKENQLSTKGEWRTFKYGWNNGHIDTDPAYTKVYKKANCGVEQFFIYVDCSKVEKTDISRPNCEPGIRRKEINTDVSNEEATFMLFETQRCNTNVVTYSGMNIKFRQDIVASVFNNETAENEEDKTARILNKNSTVALGATIENQGSTTYWTYAAEADYANKGKYLEVAVYLENAAGARALLPKGASVRIGGEEAEFAGVQNTSAIYYFKDSNNPFELDNLFTTAMIDKIKSDGGKYTTDLNVQLEFENADFSNTPSGSYKICFELLRITNPKYPIGEESIHTIRTEPFDIISGAEYGFTMKPNPDESLSYNKAMDEAEVEKNINMILNSTAKDRNSLSTDIKVKYQLYYKVKNESGVYEYVPYVANVADGDSAGIKLYYNGVDVTNKLNGTEQVIPIDRDSIPIDEDTSTEGDDSEGDTSEDDTTEETTLEGVPFKIVFNGNTITTNYKLEAKLYVDGYLECADNVIYNVSDITVP